MALTFRLICPHCKEPTRASVEAFYRWWPDEDENGEAKPDSRSTAAGASYCPECENLIGLLIAGKDNILRPIMSGDVGESDWHYYQSDLSLTETVPKLTGVNFSAAVPKHIREVLPDLSEDVGRRRNAVGSLTMCRGILEAALREIESNAALSTHSGEPLIRRIDRLKTSGLITAAIAEWAHEIRLDGNQSAHELRGDPDLAVAYLDFLKLFLEIAFDLPAKIMTVRAHKAKIGHRAVGKSGKSSA